MAYDSFFTDPARGLMEVGCWAHARRHFHKALETDPARMGTRARMIAQLYRSGEDSAARAGCAAKRLAACCVSTAPGRCWTSCMSTCWKIQRRGVAEEPGGPGGRYALKNWTALTRYCGDGDLEIDNNAHRASHARLWRSGGTTGPSLAATRAAKRRRCCGSFVASCELVKIDPFAWFRDVLSRIGDHPLTGSPNCCPTTGHPPRPDHPIN